MKRQVNTAIVGSAANSAMEEGGGADGTTMDLGRRLRNRPDPRSDHCSLGNLPIIRSCKV